MRLLIVLLSLGVCWMTAGIAYALIVGDFFLEAGILFRYPWFQLSMVDLYTGFLLFSGWMIYRERSLPVAIVWIVLLMTLGNLTSCAYALLAAVQAQGDWRAFWLGSRAEPQSRL